MIMNRIACIIVVLVAGCAAEGVDIGVSRGPTSVDAGIDVQGVDVTTPSDATTSLDVGLTDTNSSTQDAGFADATDDARIVETFVDAQTLPDGLSYPHDLTVTSGVPCMQQVVANGYASDKASCATWKVDFDKIANSKRVVPYTSQTACMALIDCFAAHLACTNWYQPACGSCVAAMPEVSGLNWQPLFDIVLPFCPTFAAAGN